jgi:F-type H+-transporting ATPase subunit epsilon
MASTFTLQVVTPQRTVLKAEVESVTAPGTDGYFGVLAHHAPMLAEVGTGQLTAKNPDGSETVIAVAGGFMEVVEEAATVLADSAELSSDIDVDRARSAAERARERLENRSDSLDVSRAEAALARAVNRLHIAGAH